MLIPNRAEDLNGDKRRYYPVDTILARSFKFARTLSVRTYFSSATAACEPLLSQYPSTLSHSFRGGLGRGCERMLPMFWTAENMCCLIISITGGCDDRASWVKKLMHNPYAKQMKWWDLCMLHATVIAENFHLITNTTLLRKTQIMSPDILRRSKIHIQSPSRYHRIVNVRGVNKNADISQSTMNKQLRREKVSYLIYCPQGSNWWHVDCVF